MLRRRYFKKVFLWLPVILVLSACGGTDEAVTSSANRVIGGSTGTERAERQVLHKGNGAEPQTLDPHRAEGVPASNILRDLFEGLTSEAPDGKIIPGMAENWTVSDAGLTYTFHLRHEARWSNGDAVTAHDFVYGLQRTVDPATLSLYSSILYPIQNAEEIVSGKRPIEDLGVEAVDDFTLIIRLNAPTPYLLGLLNHSTTYPLHRSSVERNGARFARPGKLISNGAYKLDEWIVQSHIKLVRNDQYWANDDTVIDEVLYYAIEHQDAELRRYRADELDYTTDLPYKQLAWVRQNLGDELIISPYLGSYYFGFNNALPPFRDNPALRRALSLAIDRTIITEKVSGAGEIPAYGWIPPVNNYEGAQPDWAVWTQTERNAEALRLYTQAGYSADKPLEIEIHYNTSENHKRVALAMASMWKQVLGVKTRLANQEWKVFLMTRQRKEVPGVFRSGWIGDYNDAYSFAQLLHSKNAQNDPGYYSDRYDELLDRAAAENEVAVRAGLMQEAEQVMLEDMPIIPVYFYVSKHLVKPWVGGAVPNIMDHHYTKNFYILKH
jgi:oligopeptide transport system substrate-binding protein